MEDARRYSGYDEYAGSFGPLQPSSLYSTRSRRRVPPSRQGFGDSPALSRLKRDRRPATRSFERRAKYLADRKTKRSLQPHHGADSDGVDGLQEQENQPPSPTRGLQRQVWLPTRNFAFRQRAGKLDVRAIARLDLEKIAATTDIEAIQRHLENLAFADVTLDDVQHYSDAYFLKLFQIAQLTLEYLMHVQDSLVDHSEGLEKQCDQLLSECQQLEAENGQQETEIASLKREIHQKQRTMSTLELMLLNASASSRMDSSAKENAAKEANLLVDELLAKRTDPAVAEEGSVADPVSCVLCGKRFISPEYLLRHQERRHQDAREKPKRKKQEESSSESDDTTKRKPKKATPLPKEIVEALEEKNQLAKQLLALQDHVRSEQEARDRQRQQAESQQSHLNAHMERYMEKLQTTLVEIEKKQEATKQDLLQYTKESISRIQLEAANAELLRLQQQQSSRAGRLENDDDTRTEAVHAKGDDARWAEKVEKLMDTFLKAQAQKQQEIDALEHESNKLWTKYSKLKKRVQHRPEPTMMLADLTALDAGRCGLDRGEAEEVENPVERKLPVLADKPVQTEEEQKPFVQAPVVRTTSEAAQTDLDDKSAEKPSVIAPLPIRVEEIEDEEPPALVLPLKQEPLPPPVVDNNASEVVEVTEFQDELQDTKKASLELSPRDLPTLEDESDESDDSPQDRSIDFSGIVRLQTIVRGFLAKKRVELMKLDRLSESTGPNPKVLEPSWMRLDPILSAKYDEIQRKLMEIVKAKLDLDDARLPTATYELHSSELEAEQKRLPTDAQRRIQLLTERLGPMATGEYRRHANAKQPSLAIGAAAKVHRAVQVEVVRKRLKRLLVDDGLDDVQSTEQGSDPQRQPTALRCLLSSWLAKSKECLRASDENSLDSFDAKEIEHLANAYEEGKSPVELPKLSMLSDSSRALPSSVDDAECKDEQQHGTSPGARPLTPRVGMEEDDTPPPSGRPGTPNPYAMASVEQAPDPGRSPRPDPNLHVISPFSKTPLISRRAGAAARSGTGYYNAR